MNEPYVHAGTGLIVMLERDEGGWYLAHVPALPGCVAEAKAFPEVAEDIGRAIDAVLDVLKQSRPAHYEMLTDATPANPVDQESTTSEGPPVRFAWCSA